MPNKHKKDSQARQISLEQCRANYSIPKILRLKDALYAILATEGLQTVLSGAAFRRFARLTWEALPGDCKYEAVEDSVRHLAGIEVSGPLLRALCWRLAGNLARLRNRRGVPPWTVQRAYEWAPLQITACRRELSRKGDKGALLTFQILAGTPCPLKTEKWWSLAQCRFFAGNFGFAKSYRSARGYAYTVPEQLVNLRLYGLFSPEESTAREPVFVHQVWPGSCMTWNREHLRRRFRVEDGYTCPDKHPATFPCHFCPRGYLSCPAATHRRDWTRGECDMCNREKAFFDADISMSVCVDCYAKGKR